MNALVKKLRVNAELPLVILNMPKNCESLFGAQEFRPSVPKSGEISQMIFFAKDAASIIDKLIPLTTRLSADPLLWVIYPKKSGSIKSDLGMTTGWQPLFDTGITGVASAAIDDDWSGFRMRPVEKVKSIRLEPSLRITEGIDYAARTVTLPADALKAVKKHAGMEKYFYALAFTHKKEHVEAIVGAKKPETRERRIEKMIEMLDAGMKKKK
ncbi:MAG: YdeI/OmpD-associated family protein [Gemmatimonadaceae bacterium]